MKISFLITGANGQLAKQFKDIQGNYPNYDFKFVGRQELDITNENCVSKYFKINNFYTHIINCAAYTQVDKAEEEFEIAKAINSVGVTNLAREAQKYDMSIVHFSTDYVFDGAENKPLTEDLPTSPIGNYGASKLLGEQALLKSGLKFVIVRTSWVYSNFGHNFYKTMARLGAEKDQLQVIFDQVGTPTYALDLASTVLEIAPVITKNNAGIYNYSNEGVCSWYDFAQEIMDLNKLNCAIIPVESDFYKTLAKRPHYSVLNKRKIKETFKIIIPHWKLSLKHCVKNTN